LLWLKKHYPNLPNIPGLDDPRLRFDEVGDFLHSFKHFAKVDFDYELFDEIAELMPDRGTEERKMFTQACTYVARNYGAKDALFHFGDIKYGKEFNIDSYEWYKYAALSGSPCAARRLHFMLSDQMRKMSTVRLGPEQALKLWVKSSGELGFASGEASAWREFGSSLEESYNFGRTKKRDFWRIGSKHGFYAGYDPNLEQPVLRMINEAHREQIAKDAALLAKEAAER
jgi:hypothetical protein